MAMRRAALWSSVIFIAMIPCENIVEIDGIGTLSRAFGLLTAALWLVATLLTRRPRRPSFFHIVVYLFFVWNVASLLWSFDTDSTISGIATYVQLFVFSYIIWDLFTTTTAIGAGLQAYIVGAYVTIGVILSNFFNGSIHDENNEFAGSGFNTDDVGYILALGIPVAGYLAGTRDNGTRFNPLRLINFFYIPSAMLVIAISGNRAGLIAAVPGLLLGLIAIIRTTPLARLAIPFVLAAAFYVGFSVVPQSSYDRLLSIRSEIGEGDLNGRLPIWSKGIEVFADQPIQGVGTSSHRVGVGLGKVAHNTFMSVLVEMGTIGFLLFYAILAVAIHRASCHRGWNAYFWLTLLLVWVIGSFAMSYELRKPTWLFLSLVVASAGAVVRPKGIELSLPTATSIRPTTAIGYPTSTREINWPR